MCDRGHSSSAPIDQATREPRAVDPHRRWRATDLHLDDTGAGLIVPAFGALDANGIATSQFVLPPGAPPSLIGATAHHAFVVFERQEPSASMVSNAAAVYFAP